MRHNSIMGVNEVTDHIITTRSGHHTPEGKYTI